MIIRSRADLAARHPGKSRLSEISTGQRITISHGETTTIERRMLLLGLIDGVEICVETRGRYGDLIVEIDGARFHVPAHHAERIWVEANPAG